MPGHRSGSVGGRTPSASVGVSEDRLMGNGSEKLQVHATQVLVSVSVTVTVSEVVEEAEWLETVIRASRATGLTFEQLTWSSSRRLAIGDAIRAQRLHRGLFAHRYSHELRRGIGDSDR